MPSAQEIFIEYVRPLTADERLRLAAMILNEISQALPTTPDTDIPLESGFPSLMTFTVRPAATDSDSS